LAGVRLGFSTGGRPCPTDLPAARFVARLAQFQAAAFHRENTKKTRLAKTAQGGGFSWGKSREWKLPIDKLSNGATFPDAVNLALPGTDQ